MSRNQNSKQDKVSVIPISSFDHRYHVDTTGDKYQHIREALEQSASYSRIKLLHSDDENSYITKELKMQEFSINIETTESQVVAVIGSHDVHDFEIPFLVSVPTATVFSICSNECASSLSSYASDHWHIIPVLDEAAIITTIEETNQKAQSKISTFFVDTRSNDWSFIKELVARFCLTIRQYVIITNSNVIEVVGGVREMKQLFREYGYTYSRIGSDPNVRVFLK
ncbi:hypothetical protein WA171_003662, partial [Blastocystis sp. BT1]